MLHFNEFCSAPVFIIKLFLKFLNLAIPSLTEKMALTITQRQYFNDVIDFVSYLTVFKTKISVVYIMQVTS